MKQYTYLGVSLNERLSWKNHVDHLLGQGERKMAACLFWTGSANLPLSFVERLFQTYVHASICFGLKFVTASPQLARFQTRLLQCRRVLGWPRGSPSLAVQGQLAWHDACTTRLILAAGLWARLLSLPRGCFAGHLAYAASQHSQSWVCSLAHELACKNEREETRVSGHEPIVHALDYAQGT